MPHFIIDSRLPNKNIYKLKCSLRSSAFENYRFIYRTLKIRGSNTLYRLAGEILDSFGFRFDQSYGFFSNLENIYDSKENYSSSIDDGEWLGHICRHRRPRIIKGTRNVRIRNVFEPGKRMLFFFDPEICWEFVVECVTVSTINPDEMYPYVCQIKGGAPEQYPFWS